MKAVVLAAALMGLIVTAAAACDCQKQGKRSSHISAPAPAPAHGGGSTCMSTVMNSMITCMDYVLEGSMEKKPGKACCNGTMAVMKEEGSKCLCTAFSAAPKYSIKVDLAKAAALPSLCHISSDPYLSKCLALAEVPVAAPPKAVSHHKQKKQTMSAPAPAPAQAPAQAQAQAHAQAAKGSATVVSISYVLMTVLALLPLAFSV